MPIEWSYLMFKFYSVDLQLPHVYLSLVILILISPAFTADETNIMGGFRNR